MFVALPQWYKINQIIIEIITIAIGAKKKKNLFKVPIKISIFLNNLIKSWIGWMIPWNKFLFGPNRRCT